MKLIKTDTWLPLFNGYYYSFFDGTENLVEYESDLSKEEYQEYYKELHEAGVTHEYFQENLFELFDYSDCWDAMSEYICNGLLNMDSCDIIHDVTFQSTQSPKYYNFSTDSINCEIEYDENKLKEYIENNMSEFREYIESTYTSCDGFSSSYSNDVNDWLDYSDLSGHELGSFLQFMFINEDDDAVINLYYESNVMEAASNSVKHKTKEFIESYKESIKKEA